jgi:hypothetical protein
MNGGDYEGEASELPSVDDFGGGNVNCGAGRWSG